jgi:2-iminoacetate synthase ThiH
MSSLSSVLRRCDAGVARILDSVLSGATLLSEADATTLLTARSSTVAVCAAADAVRARDAGDAVSYVITRNINFTNACVKKCGFCAFSRTALEREGYWLPLGEVARRAREAAALGATEICVQAGLPPGAPADLYERTAEAVRDAVADAPEKVHLHAFSPEEVKYAATLSRSTFAEVRGEGGGGGGGGGK